MDIDQKRLKLLKEMFDSAISQKDKQGIIVFGRKYYEELHGDVWSTEDTEKFQNEINLLFAGL